jgi:hypothetical protein
VSDGRQKMLEKIIEMKLKKAVKKAGGMTLKFVSPGLDSLKIFR